MTDPLPVTVRMLCGAYVARCKGKSASATSDAETAAARAAAKAFGTLDTRIRLKSVPPDNFWALPHDADGYLSAPQIVRDRIARQYGPRAL